MPRQASLEAATARMALLEEQLAANKVLPVGAGA